MANQNQPFGLRFIGFSGGAAMTSALRERRNAILSTNNTAIYTGDLVKHVAGGYLEQWTASTAVSQCAGVFAGCQFYSTAANRPEPSKYWPGSGAAAGTVAATLYQGVLGPVPLFVIQTDATGITVADIGANADIAVGSGSTTTGQSGSYLNTSTLAVTATLPLRIVDLWANWVCGNSPTGAGTGSSLQPGTEAGAYNWAVVALNVTGTTGI